VNRQGAKIAKKNRDEPPRRQDAKKVKINVLGDSSTISHVLRKNILVSNGFLGALAPWRLQGFSWRS
jgi:hypothetical protein